MAIDIGSGNGGVAAALSNFHRRKFKVTFRDVEVEVESMEGFLQSLKFDKPHIQIAVMQLWGLPAKYRGKRRRWWRTQTLYWMGQPIDRHSDQYQELLYVAFLAMFSQDAGAKKALLGTGDAELTHSIGKSDPHRTVLTETEFCGLLKRIRTELRKQEAQVQSQASERSARPEPKQRNASKKKQRSNR